MGKLSFLYLCFWASFSIVSLVSVRVFLNKVDQFRNHSSDLRQVLDSFLCFSLFFAFIFNNSLSMYEKQPFQFQVPPIWFYFYLDVMLHNSIKYMTDDSSISWFFSFVAILLFLVSLYATMCGVYLLLVSCQNPSKFPKTVSVYFFHWFAWAIFTCLATIIYRDADHTIKFEFGALGLPYAIGAILAYFHFLYLNSLKSPVNIKLHSSIKIIVTIIGDIVASYFLEEKTIHLFWLLVSLAIFWMGNIAMIRSTRQAGIFGFILGAILDVAGEVFDKKIFMWLVGVCCAVLLIFFENMDKFNLPYFRVGADHHKEVNEQESSMV